MPNAAAKFHGGVLLWKRFATNSVYHVKAQPPTGSAYLLPPLIAPPDILHSTYDSRGDPLLRVLFALSSDAVRRIKTPVNGVFFLQKFPKFLSHHRGGF
jgi:hypothetical protein